MKIQSPKSSVRRFLLEIITQAILDEDSIFYKDYLNNDLGNESTFINLIFGDSGFIQSHFTPLLPLNKICDSQLSEAQFNLCAKIQDIILERFLNCPNDFKEKECILAPLRELINSESAVIAKDPRLEDRKTLTYIELVQDYLQVKTIMERLEKAGTQEKIETQEDSKVPFEQDLTDLLADLLLKQFSQLSKIKVKNDRFGLTLGSFWMFLGARYTEGSMGSKIQEKFEKRIFRHLKNMHPIDPHITGCLINSLLLTYISHNSIDNRWKTLPEMANEHHLPNSPIMNSWPGKFSEKFASFLREEFRRSLISSQHFRKDLPENIRYDVTKNILYFTPFGRDHEESFLLHDHEK